MHVRTIALLLLSLFGCSRPDADPAATARTLVSTTELDTDPVTYVAAHPAATAQSVASNGSSFLVTWRDWRDLSTKTRERIYATLVFPDGRLLDPAGIIVARGTYSFLNEDPTDVVFDGTDYVVAWSDTGVFAARVSTAGAVLDAPPVAMFSGPGPGGERGVRAACAPGVCMIVWEEGWVYGTRFGPALSILDATPIVIASEITSSSPDVAFDGTNFVVLWDRYDFSGVSTIVGQRVRPSDGSRIDATPFAVSSSTAYVYRPQLACRGAENCVASWQGQAPGLAHLRAGAAITTRASTTAGALSFDGIAYHLAWSDNPSSPNDENIHHALIDEQTLVETGDTVAAATRYVARYPAVANTSTVALVVWEGSQGGYYDTLSARIGGTGLLDPEPVPLSLQENYQTTPAVAFDGTNYLWVWRDDRDIGSDYYGSIYALRVAPDGTPLDASPSLLGIYGFEPRVGFDGTNFVVIWHQETAYNLNAWVRGARVDTSGVVLDSPPLTVYFGPSICRGNDPSSSFGVALACAPGECVALSSHQCTGRSPPITSSLLAAVHVDPVLGPVTTTSIAETSTGLVDPAIAYDGTQFIAVWSDRRNGLPDLYAARLAGGMVLDPGGAPVVTATLADATPRIAHANGTTLVAWRRGRRLLATRVSTAAVSLDGNGIEISTTTATFGLGDVAGGDGLFFVVWNDARRGPGAIRTDLYGAWIDASGTVIDPGGSAVATGANGGTYARLVHGDMAWFTTYARAEGVPPIERVHARFVTPDGFPCDDGDLCSIGDVIGSGACVPGPICPGGECRSGACIPTDAGVSEDAAEPEDAIIDAAGDTGTSTDASVDVDGGEMSDAAFEDANAEVDATASKDAGSNPDLGDPQPELEEDGCGCRSARARGDRASLALLLAVSLLSIRRRRKL